MPVADMAYLAGIQAYRHVASIKNYKIIAQPVHFYEWINHNYPNEKEAIIAKIPSQSK